MDFTVIKRVLLAILAIGVACALIWAIFKVMAFLFVAASILIVAGIIYAVVVVKFKNRDRTHGSH